MASGLQVIPLTIGIILGAAFGGFILSKTGRYKYIPFVGGLILFFGLMLLSFTDIESSRWQITVCLLIVGLGLGPQLSIITTAIQNSVPHKNMGVATATLTTFRQIGSSVGVATLSSYLLQRTNNLLIENNPKMSPREGQNTIELKNILILSSEETVILQNALNGALESVIIVTAFLALLIIPLSLMVVEIPLKTSIEKT
jgi:MFS family permease